MQQSARKKDPVRQIALRPQEMTNTQDFLLMTVISDLQSRTKMYVHFHKLIFHPSVIYHKTLRAKLNV